MAGKGTEAVLDWLSCREMTHARCPRRYRLQPKSWRDGVGYGLSFPGVVLGVLLLTPLRQAAAERGAGPAPEAVRTITITSATLKVSPVAAGRLPTDREAEAAYDAARRQYGTAAASDGTPDMYGVSATIVGPDGTPEAVVLADPTKRVIAGKDYPHNVPMDTVRVVVDVENTTLRDVFGEIVGQAAQFTGPWTVKWRLKPDNTNLLDERVNLTAEAPFGEFVTLLTERVRNLSGVQLFVTTFHESRVILVTDTYN